LFSAFIEKETAETIDKQTADAALQSSLSNHAISDQVQIFDFRVHGNRMINLIDKNFPLFRNKMYPYFRLRFFLLADDSALVFVYLDTEVEYFEAERLGN
jgi:hypothetical protein